jgi:5'-methylthioadenosine phosphorylase
MKSKKRATKTKRTLLTKKSPTKKTSTAAAHDIKIGIIGGSGLYDLPGFHLLADIEVKTPFGKPSGNYKIFDVEGIKVAFLARHGSGHTINPSELPAKANIYGFKSLGVDRLISISSVGSLREEIAPEHLVVPDQVIDRTKSRPATFFENGIVGHVSFADPFCSALSKIVYEELSFNTSTKVHFGGTYVCMEGPAFSTRAESHLYRSWGASVIGMTALPEAKLAREAEMSYALIAMSTDYDCWKVEEHPVTVEMVMSHVTNNTNSVKKALPAIVKKISAMTHFPHAEAARFAVISARDKIPTQTKKKLNLLYGKYF